MPSTFFSAYIADSPRALGFLPASFRDPSARIRLARQAASRTIAPALVLALREQTRALPASPARQANLEALAAGGVAAVVTGQQVGLFLGPLYTFYKAASVIALARAIGDESGIRCVPIFWLQTEDHDFPEIDHCHVPASRSSPPLRVQVGGGDDRETAGSSRVSVAYRRLGPDVLIALEEIEGALGHLPHARPFLELLRAHYRPGQSLAAAFAGVLAALFDEEGLLFVDPRHAAVAELAAPVYRSSILSCEAISETLVDRGRQLQAAGFDEQVHIRPGSPLVFFHKGRADGPRFRLERRAELWSCAGRPVTLSPTPDRLSEERSDGGRSDRELLDILEQEPLRFSSSAVLRPIVQDTLLPTVAYVAGPAEVSYFAQLAPLYRRFDLTCPIIAPRARFRCLEPNIQSLLGKLGLRPADAERPRDELLRAVAAAAPSAHPTPEDVEERLMGGLARGLDDFEAMVPGLDPTLGDPARKTRETVARAVSRLVERYRRALLEQDRIAIDRIDRLRDALCPEGVPQERFYSLPYLACKYGSRSFKDRILSAIVPPETEIRNLDL